MELSISTPTYAPHTTVGALKLATKPPTSESSDMVGVKFLKTNFFQPNSEKSLIEIDTISVVQISSILFDSI